MRYHMELHRCRKIPREDADLNNLYRPLRAPSSCSCLLSEMGESKEPSSQAEEEGTTGKSLSHTEETSSVEAALRAKE